MPILFKPSVVKDEVLELRLSLECKYELGDKSTSKSFQLPIRLYPKNKILWKKCEKNISAFISYKSPVIQKIVEHVKEEGNLKSDNFKSRIRLACWLYSFIKSQQFRYSSDPISFNSKNAAIHGLFDDVKYPEETLIKRSGDCDDMTVLFTTLFESAGLDTNIVFVPEHVFVMFNISKNKSLKLDKYLKRYVIKRNDGLWLALETTAVSQKNFKNACLIGKKVYNLFLSRKIYNTKKLLLSQPSNTIKLTPSMNNKMNNKIKSMLEADWTLDKSWTYMLKDAKEIGDSDETEYRLTIFLGTYNYFSDERNKDTSLRVKVGIGVDYIFSSGFGIDGYFKWGGADLKTEIDKEKSDIRFITLGLGGKYEYRFFSFLGLGVSSHILTHNQNFNADIRSKTSSFWSLGFDITPFLGIYFSKGFGIGFDFSYSAFFSTKVDNTLDLLATIKFTI